MISTLILATALASQVHANDGPPREWLPAVVDGRTVQLWGWRDASGGVGYRVNENAHVFAPKAAVKPKPASVPLGAGMVLEANGTINSGVNLQATHATGMIETNDPELGAKLNIQDRCPNDPNDEPDPNFDDGSTVNPPWGWVAISLGALLIIVILFG